MVLYPDVPERNTSRQSLVAVYLHSMIYYDNIYSTFALILQYFLFVYKYNILFYDSSAIAAELILLSVLFLLNFFRSFFARTGNKGKKYGYLCTALLLHALLVAGYVYILALQSNALYLQIAVDAIGIALTGLNMIMTVAVIIVYRVNQ